jgi:hypothetical protein
MTSGRYSAICVYEVWGLGQKQPLGSQMQAILNSWPRRRRNKQRVAAIPVDTLTFAHLHTDKRYWIKLLDLALKPNEVNKSDRDQTFISLGVISVSFFSRTANVLRFQCPKAYYYSSSDSVTMLKPILVSASILERTHVEAMYLDRPLLRYVD